MDEATFVRITVVLAPNEGRLRVGCVVLYKYGSKYQWNMIWKRSRAVKGISVS